MTIYPNITPKQAHLLVVSLAKKAGQSMHQYCKERGVASSTVSRWQTKTKSKAIDFSILQKLTQ